MNAADLPLIDIGRGGPAALLIHDHDIMVVISLVGDDDLVLEILPLSMRGQTLWPRDAPVCQELLARLKRIRNFPNTRFLLNKFKVSYCEYEMKSGR